MADLDGKNRSTIISHTETDPMENPRSLAVDPRVGYVVLFLKVIWLELTFS